MLATPAFAEDDMDIQPQFAAAAFMHNLRSMKLGTTLLSATALPSTQALLKGNASLFPDGTVCVADVQYQGVGAMPCK